MELSLRSLRDATDRGFAETRRLVGAVDLLTQRENKATSSLTVGASTGPTGRSSRAVGALGNIGAPFDLDFDGPQLELMRMCITLSRQLEDASILSGPHGNIEQHATVAQALRSKYACWNLTGCM